MRPTDRITPRQGRPTPKLGMLVLQPTPFCNIDCRYCYLPNRGEKARMSPLTMATAFSRVFESGWVEGTLDVVWHAGEPMTLPPSYYEAAFALAESLRPPEIHISHGMQTNATLLTDDWCRLLLAHEVAVGVSIDGPQAMHDARRVTRAGTGTFDNTMRGIASLRRNGVPFHAITVLSREAMDDPARLFAFYATAGIREVCLNVEETEGRHVSTMLGAPDAADAYGQFLEAFWALHAANPGALDMVREIDGTLAAVLRPAAAPFGNPMAEPFAIASVSHAGDVSTFSPELLGQRDARYADFVVGNVADQTLAEMLEGHAMAALARDVAAGVEACRASCNYFSVCGGGEPANKLAETGRLDATETAHCRSTRMRATDVVLRALERMADAHGRAA